MFDGYIINIIYVNVNIEEAGRFLDIKTTAQWCSVSPRTIRRWISAGLPIFQASPRSKILLRADDVQAFLSRQRPPQSDLDRLVAQTWEELVKRSVSDT